MALLDALRLVAALMVVLFHYTAWHHGYWSADGGPSAPEVWPALSRVTAFGNAGVQLFFIISGLVVFRSLQGRSVGRFLGSRAGRIFPAFWFAVLFSGAVQMVLWRAQKPELTWGQVLGNLTLAGPPLLHIPSVDGVYWTLWIEARFYVGLLLVRWALRRLRADDARGWTGFCLAWVAASAVAIAVVGVPSQNSRLGLYLIPTYAGLFAGGMMLYLMSAHGFTWARGAVLVGAVAQAAWATALDMPQEVGAFTPYRIPGGVFALLIVGFFALVAALVFTRANRVGWAWATGAGALTYPVYLLHEVNGWFIIDALSPEWPKWLVLGVALGAVLVLSWAVHRYVEEPLGPWLKAWVERGCAALGRGVGAFGGFARRGRVERRRVGRRRVGRVPVAGPGRAPGA